MLQRIGNDRLPDLAADQGRDGAFPASVKWVLVLGVFGLVLLQIPGLRPAGWLVLNFYLFCIFEFLLVVPHELAHALAAVLLRMRVFRIALGTGRTITTFRRCGWTWEINSLLIGGMTRVSARSTRFYRTRHVLVTAAGPLANIAVLAVIAGVVHQRGRPLDTAFTSNICLGMVFSLANLSTLLLALWPRRIRTAKGDALSDGLALLKTAVLSDQEVLARLVWYYSLEGAERRQQGDPAGAMTCYDDGLQQLGPEPLLLMDKAVLLIDQTYYAEARALLQDLLAREDLSDGMTLLTKNNLACADLHLPDPEALAEADRCSAETWAALPQVHAFRSTRGAVLLALGRIEEGLALLKTSILQDKPWVKKAVDACWIAIGESRRGNTARAEAFARLAETLAPDSRLMEQMRQELLANDARPRPH